MTSSNLIICSVQFSSVAQLCSTLCNPIHCTLSVKTLFPNKVKGTVNQNFNIFSKDNSTHNTTQGGSW